MMDAPAFMICTHVGKGREYALKVSIVSTSEEELPCSTLRENQTTSSYINRDFVLDTTAYES